MKAAVIGTGWGQVHVHALRALGVQVIALCGREREATEAAARQLGVPQACTELAALRDLPLDLLTLATPPDTHAPLAAQLPPGLPLLCEKPVLGWRGQAAQLAAFPERCTVNYAFAFLPGAEQLAAAVAEAGGAMAVRVLTVHDLGRPFSGPDALSELASHPWSFVSTLLGLPELLQAELGPAQALLRLRHGGVPVQLQVRAQPGLAGLRHAIEIDTAAGLLSLEGRFRLGQPWVFEPARRGAQALGPAPDSGDAWMAANQQAIAAQLRALLGEGLPEPRLFSPARAWALDAAVAEAVAEAVRRSDRTPGGTTV